MSIKAQTNNASRTRGGRFIGLGAAVVAAVLLFAAPPARAQASLSAADKEFILAAAQGGMTEVRLGELAAQKGARDDVKALGQMMVKDHTSINDDLKALATLKGVTLPDNLDPKHQRMAERFAGLTGSEFDDAFINDMRKGHKKDARDFKAESASTSDSDIKGFVDKTIPVVEGHLRRIAAMKK